MKMTVIFPVFNEMKSPFFKNTLLIYDQWGLFDNQGLEFIFVDGASQDDTTSLIKAYSSNIISLPNSNRAQRIIKGVSSASAPIILLHHPRSVLEKGSIQKVLNTLYPVKDKFAWGGFTHKFDNQGLVYKFTSWYSNKIRARIKEIIYLDHCIFFTKNFVENKLIDLPSAPIFEDTIISQELRTHGPPILINKSSITSSIRFKKNGFFFQSLLNQIMKLMFSFGFNFEQMDKIYEKSLNLNSGKKSND
ncbi:glycosyltransferase [bacterium]|nr:glycosyltransferase [bacterium]